MKYTKVVVSLYLHFGNFLSDNHICIGADTHLCLLIMVTTIAKPLFQPLLVVWTFFPINDESSVNNNYIPFFFTQSTLGQH